VPVNYLYWIFQYIEYHTVAIQNGDFQMPITLSKIQYDTRSIGHFEALEQTLRLRLVSGPAAKIFSFGIARPVQYMQ
jgi:hypothetical protein